MWRTTVNIFGGGPNINYVQEEVVLVLSLIEGGQNAPADAVEEMAHLLGRSVGSVRFKVGNLRHFINGSGGLEHGSDLDRRVVENYRDHQDELRNTAAMLKARLLGGT